MGPKFQGSLTGSWGVFFSRWRLNPPIPLVQKYALKKSNWRPFPTVRLGWKQKNRWNHHLVCLCVVFSVVSGGLFCCLKSVTYNWLWITNDQFSGGRIGYRTFQKPWISMDMSFAPNIDGSNPKKHWVSYCVFSGFWTSTLVHKPKGNKYIPLPIHPVGWYTPILFNKKQPSNSNPMEENGTRMKHIPFTTEISWAAIRTVSHSIILIGLQGSLQWLSNSI